MTGDEILDGIRKEQERQKKGKQFISGLSKSKELPPKVIDPPKRGYKSHTTCRRCGFGIIEAVWRYCPNCGQRIKHADFAGALGWTNKTAEAAFEKMMEGEHG